MPLLQLKNIECYYGPVLAIKGVSLSVEEGSVATILGANGAGKSTILKTISGFIEPEKGEIRYKEENIAGLGPQQAVKRGICHVPEGREVFDELTVAENLRMGAYLRKDRHNVPADLERVLGYFGPLRERYRQRAGWLSGGEQQMLAIGRALLSRPRLLTMDEPSLGLSPMLVKEIFKIIRRINTEEGTTILLVEQNARLALQTASYGYILEVGRVVLDNTTRELMENQDVQEFYLGVQQESIRGKKRWKRKKLWR
ncbi:MAG: ABC transporter ATP-binding protein [Proteobacteria bacterium]|nr:ABC transporter ATP-binding protein [Pseudomonadota bacterium]